MDRIAKSQPKHVTTGAARRGHSRHSRPICEQAAQRSFLRLMNLFALLDHAV